MHQLLYAVSPTEKRDKTTKLPALITRKQRMSVSLYSSVQEDLVKRDGYIYRIIYHVLVWDKSVNVRDSVCVRLCEGEMDSFISSEK